MSDRGTTVAVLDIGKTNAKVALIDRDTGTELALRTAANAARPDGPYPHADVDRLWDFACDALASLGRGHRIDGIAITAHGAAGALLSGAEDGDGLALPVLDYEHDGPDTLAAEYDAARPPFAETFSPRLPCGLNLGAQLFWQQRRFADAFAGARRFLTYPQYWAWRLTGAMATERTSLGCHTDLWRPAAGSWSSLVERMGWAGLMAPVGSAGDVARLRSGLARRLGLDPALPVASGIHDSNASLLPHLRARRPPFTVVSSGTWVIVMGVGGGMDRLDPRRDGLANVDADGNPVPCARFMGGREFALLAGDTPATPDAADLDAVIAGGVMALPGFAPGVGPFPGSEGRWTVPPESLSPGRRAAAASLYAALVTTECMAIAGAGGPVVIEGPLAGNGLYCAALAALSGRPVGTASGRTGTSQGAALLLPGQAAAPPDARPATPLDHPGLDAYAAAWRRRAGAGPRRAS